MQWQIYGIRIYKDIFLQRINQEESIWQPLEESSFMQMETYSCRQADRQLQQSFLIEYDSMPKTEEYKIYYIKRNRNFKSRFGNGW